MKKLVTSVAVLLMVLAIGFGLTGCGVSKNNSDIADTPAAEYELVFNDEFNGTELDKSVWATSGHEVRRGGYWDPSQVRVENGQLIIETSYKSEEETEFPGYYSGEVLWPTMRTTYGYYEARVKIQNIRGVWSAFWLQPDEMGQEDSTPSEGSEIDIFESAIPNKIQNAIHYAGYNKRKTNPVFVDGLYNEYHVCGLDWKKDKMTFYYDGEVMWEITDPEMISTKPVSMRFSTEIGGKADKNGIPKPGIFWIGNGVIDESADLLPSLFEVDYLRIYDNGDLVLTK